MSEMNWQEAVSALAGEGEPAVEAEAPPVEQVESAPDADVDVETPAVDETDDLDAEELDEIGANIDINSFPEELRPYAQAIKKQFQGDYTRKRQAQAELEKRYQAFEEFGGPDELAQAVELASSFRSDPLGTFQQVQTYLQNAGLLQNAPTPPAPEPTFEPAQTNDPYLQQIADEIGVDNPLYGAMKEMREMMSNFQTERETFMQQQQEAQQQAAEFQALQENQAIEARIRAEHPEWDDEDIDVIYDLGIAMGGDLELAAERYENAVEARVLSRYWERKSGQPKKAGALPSTQGAGQATAEEAARDYREVAREATEWFRQVESAE